jgi:hypothetical protein
MGSLASFLYSLVRLHHSDTFALRPISNVGCQMVAAYTTLSCSLFIEPPHCVVAASMVSYGSRYDIP